MEGSYLAFEVDPTKGFGPRSLEDLSSLSAHEKDAVLALLK